MILIAFKICVLLLIQFGSVKVQNDGLLKLKSAIVDFLSLKFSDRKVDYVVDFKGQIDEKMFKEGCDIQVVKESGSDYRGYQTFKVIISYGNSVAETFVQALVRTFENVLVAKVDLKRGEVIESGEKFFEMFSFEKIETTFLKDDFVCDVGLVYGKKLKKAVRKGEVIYESYFEDLPVIKVGELVKVIARAGNVKVEISGIAKENGILNERIRVLNPASGKMFYGRVIGDGVVEVEVKN